MNICIAGWYFNGDLLADIKKYRDGKVTIVSHKPVSQVKLKNTYDIVYIENIGLEFGCYDHYLKNIWDRKSNVLFMHDDIYIEDIENTLKNISEIDKDCAYIFRDKAEEKANGGKHGRAIFCKANFLHFITNFHCDCDLANESIDQHHHKDQVLPATGIHSGFWFDPFNTGHIAGKPPKGIYHYNTAIYHFHWLLGRIRDRRCGPKENWPNPKEKMGVVNRLYFNEFQAGRRNCWRHIEREIAAYRNKK